MSIVARSQSSASTQPGQLLGKDNAQGLRIGPVGSQSADLQGRPAAGFETTGL